MKIKNRIEKLKILWRIIRAYLADDENALLHLFEEEAKRYLGKLLKLGVSNTEEIEDLLFHISSYLEIPEAVKNTSFPLINTTEFIITEKGEIKIIKSGKDLSKDQLLERINYYTKYIEEVEKLRAVERDFIFESMKSIPLGFKL